MHNGVMETEDNVHGGGVVVVAGIVDVVVVGLVVVDVVIEEVVEG